MTMMHSTGTTPQKISAAASPPSSPNKKGAAEVAETASFIDALWDDPLYSHVLKGLGCRTLVNLACSSRSFRSRLQGDEGSQLLSHLQPPKVAVALHKPGCLRIDGSRGNAANEACHVACSAALAWRPPMAKDNIPAPGIGVHFYDSVPIESTSTGLAVFATHRLLACGRKMPSRTGFLGELTLRGKVGIPHRRYHEIGPEEASRRLHEAWDRGMQSVIMTSSYLGTEGFAPPRGLLVHPIAHVSALFGILDTCALATPPGTNEITCIVL